ncbi:LytR C-terminal domain-containing protein [Microbacterium sp. W1N]|uniref:LytR C-terminal domain-containing protein n=1 Tax=Microbacterium festucae TaxID=2977531 RepID=UPI0021BE9AB5|nr:LytR C-terminal domain-containing protein [Microbacterium festucae]MCT9821096.1 LytR C-terminal domain-containing protein [Microbacterium festucae]
MPHTPAAPDRFDDLPADSARVGAHRAENPRIRAGVVLVWTIVSIVVLVTAGIVGTLLATGKIALAPSPAVSVAPSPNVDPVVDPSYPVLVLNATTRDGLAGQVREQLVGAGWAAGDVTAGEAGSQDFAHTTVYYSNDADQAAALGVAEVLGGARTEQSEAYVPADDPNTGDVDESQAKQLVVVIGADWAGEGVTP